MRARVVVSCSNSQVPIRSIDLEWERQAAVVGIVAIARAHGEDNGSYAGARSRCFSQQRIIRLARQCMYGSSCGRWYYHVASISVSREQGNQCRLANVQTLLGDPIVGSQSYKGNILLQTLICNVKLRAYARRVCRYYGICIHVPFPSYKPPICAEVFPCVS